MRLNSREHEFPEGAMATDCNWYTPRRLPWYLRPFAWLHLIKDPGRFDNAFEAWDPMTPEEIREMQAASQDQELVALQRGGGGVPGATISPPPLEEFNRGPVEHVEDFSKDSDAATLAQSNLAAFHDEIGFQPASSIDDALAAVDDDGEEGDE